MDTRSVAPQVAHGPEQLLSALGTDALNNSPSRLMPCVALENAAGLDGKCFVARLGTMSRIRLR